MSNTKLKHSKNGTNPIKGSKALLFIRFAILEQENKL